MSYTVVYTGSVQSANDTTVTLTVDTTQNGDGSYTVTAASGTWAGQAFSGLYSQPGTPDQEAFSGGDTTNVVGGVDSHGVSLATPSAPALIYDNGGVLSYFWGFDINDPGSANGIGTLTLASSDVPCFLRGTRVAAEHGEVAVEDLAIGALVRTLGGALLPVRWIGRRRYVRHPLAGVFWNDVSPVRIAADAIADGVPRRDLFVSPDHSLYLAGHLINAKNLLNGGSIARDTSLRDIEYFHIELDRHEVILAENTPAETYLDNGNAAQWHNADERPGGVAGSAPAALDAWYAPHAFGRHPVLGPLRNEINARAANRRPLAA